MLAAWSSTESKTGCGKPWFLSPITTISWASYLISQCFTVSLYNVILNSCPSLPKTGAVRTNEMARRYLFPSTIFVPIHLGLWFARTTTGSGLENNKVVPEMKGGRMEPGGSPTGHRGRDPGQAGTLDWSQAHIPKLVPVPPNTHFCGCMNIFELLRTQLYYHCLNSLV